MGTPSLKIVQDTVHKLLENAGDLFYEHWQESARNKQLMVLKPDVEGYTMLENSGKLVTLYAYIGDVLVGYSCNIITNHLHYADLTVAYNDVIFIHPDYRDTPVGLRLIKETEKSCKEKGASLILWHAKENTALSKILPRMKCKVQEIIFSKEL